MLPVTWKKIFADLWSNKARSILVALSIAVGIFAVGLISSSFSIVKQDMAADYSTINPHTALIFTDDFDTSMLDSLRTIPGVESLDARYNLWVKVETADGRQYPINLNSIQPLEAIQVDQLVFETGSKTLNDGEIYIERQGAAGLGLAPGDPVMLVLNDGQTRELVVAGTVHDVHANPFKFTSKTSGYVTPATMADLGGSDLNNYMLLVTDGSHTDAAHVRQVAERVSESLKASGKTVFNINVTNPGQHPAQSTIDTVLVLMGALSVMAIFLSIFLVINTITALMGQQIRQIGVMKAVGATTGNIVGIYLGLALAFGIIALIIAIPLAALGSRALTRFLIGLLNATPSAFAIPTRSIVLMLAIGLAVPLLGALFPVLAGARMTVRKAITNYGLVSSGRPGTIDRLLEILPWLPRPLILSLRNTFHRKARLALTLTTLTLGGAIFIAIFGVSESIDLEINQTAGYYQSDVNVELAQFYPFEELKSAITAIPGVESVEGWSIVRGNVMRKDGENDDQVFVYGAPDDTRLVQPVMTEGRWLEASDDNAVVVSNQFMKLRPDIKIGDTLQLRLNEIDTPLKVVGIFRMAGNFATPFTYVRSEDLVVILGNPGQVNRLMVVGDSHAATAQADVVKSIQEKLTETGYAANLTTGAEFISQQRAQVNTLIYLLLVMGVLIALVGGLGLMGTMGMNVLERTREIGVMRSIGAQNGAIFQMVVVEGILIGVISWLLSILAAIPITRLLDDRLGVRLMTVPVTYIFSTRGMFVWLVIALVLAVIASLVPARNAVRLTVRDVLAYE